MVVGNTYIFRLTATKDGVIWDLTGASVKFGLVSSSGVLSTKTATITNAVGGIAEYVSVVSDLNAAGIWIRSWQIEQGALVQESVPLSFAVIAGLVA